MPESRRHQKHLIRRNNKKSTEITNSKTVIGLVSIIHLIAPGGAKIIILVCLE